MKRLIGTFVLALVASGLAGCGGKSEAEKEREREAKSGRGTVTCTGEAMSGETGLPVDFPQLSGVRFVKASETGPSHIVDGFANTALEDLYRDYKSEFEKAGYTILFDEIEEDDAEISYKTKDESSEGQVALRSCDEDKTSVHITNRPE